MKISRLVLAKQNVNHSSKSFFHGNQKKWIQTQIIFIQPRETNFSLFFQFSSKIYRFLQFFFLLWNILKNIFATFSKLFWTYFLRKCTVEGKMSFGFGKFCIIYGKLLEEIQNLNEKNSWFLIYKHSKKKVFILWQIWSS